ncbi:MAG: SpoIIE family protein phosphatase, partial [Synergistaceae bacterium]|nr:SpoIIE family protein phosphatase [Synergistaceae bacterium]
PKIIPPFLNHEAFDISATMYPAKEVGGDFYDFFMIDDDHLALVMADVSGKGVPAALFMVIAKTLIKNRSMMGGTPGEILYDVNNQLCESNDSSLFVTVWLGILELSTGKVIASNAGHEPPAVRRAGGKYELFETTQNTAVAIIEDMEFTDGEFQLEHLDTIYLYTDGVTEATNINRQLYGTERMIDELNKTLGAPADEVLSIMNKSVMDFTGEAMQFDDLTMLCLQFFGRPDELTVEAKTERLHDVIAFVDEYLEKWGCPMDFISEIELAVEEIFVNIAHYAYNDKEGGGTATISIRYLGKDVEIIFTDSGTPYNPLEHDDPDITLSAEEREIGGLGIYIVKQSMNSVSYEYIGDNNVLKIRKDIHETEE